MHPKGGELSQASTSGKRNLAPTSTASMGSDIDQETSKPASTVPRRHPSSGLLSKLSFMRSSGEGKSRHGQGTEVQQAPASRSLAIAVQENKTRRRRGSLRKVALLGKGAQRDRKDVKALTVDTSQAAAYVPLVTESTFPAVSDGHDVLGLKASDLTPRPTMNQDASLGSLAITTASSAGTLPRIYGNGEGVNSYNSTTDEEDLLSQSRVSPASQAGVSSVSESYFVTRGPTMRPRSFQRTKSPLSYSGLATTPLPPPDSGRDYSDTEWWGWVVLIVTWFVFVIGMGSCLDVWSWAWDVGKTPYAPPELENDPMLPIVGYYPALMILTCVMAWVWVVVAWVGMKYFRHAKISGD